MSPVVLYMPRGLELLGWKIDTTTTSLLNWANWCTDGTCVPENRRPHLLFFLLCINPVHDLVADSLSCTMRLLGNGDFSNLFSNQVKSVTYSKTQLQDW